MNYLPKKVYCLPNGSRDGRRTSRRRKYHIYKVSISQPGYNYTYYKVHLKRQDKSKIKYFKSRLEAQLFLDSLQINRYL